MAPTRNASPPDLAPAGEFAEVVQRLRRVAASLPGVVEATSYGTPALKVAGKLIVRIKDADTLVLMSTPDEKEMLLEVAPDIYFETDHYKGWPSLLIRMARITDGELGHRLEAAWLRLAPKTLAKNRRAD